jgi:hypothetical protein
MKTKIFLAAALGFGLMTVIGIDTVVAQVTTTRVSTRQVQRLITRIETKIEILKDEAERVSTRTARQEAGTADDLGRYLDQLNASVSRLDDSFDARQPINDELRQTMSDATTVDQFMTQNRVSVSAQSQWRSLKRDFNTLAGYNSLSWNWNQTVPAGPTTGGFPSGSRPYIVSDAQMSTLLSRIELKTDIFKRQITTALSNTRADSSRSDRSITDYIAGFETAADRLKQRFDARQSTSTDVSDVLTRAAYIDQFMSRNDLTTEAEAQWRNLRGDLNLLATDYRLSWNWNQTLPPYPGTIETGPVGGRGLDASLSGTYRLNTSLSDNVSTAVDRALGTQSTEADNQRQRLQRRLQSPEMIAIEKSNATVTMASSNQPRVTFQADGVARSETNPNGRTVTTTATADADGLIINYQGERANDFYVTFAPMNDRRLKVTRRVYLENTSDAVTVSSIYDKVDNVARWNMVTAGGDTSTGVINDSFIIPNGTRLNAVLRTAIASGTTQATDRITLAVTTPTQYRGALIMGRVITEENTNRVAGRSRVLVSFDSIRMPNGQTYRFGGLVNGVVAADGDNIAVAQQTPARQTRAGVGNILGALIGAVSGRPIEQTAETGVSGSILTQSREAFSIGEGSQFIITATTDSGVNQPR